MPEMLLTYDSSRRPPPMVDELVQAIRFRDLIRQLVRRDVLTRYKRSFLGVAWTMLNPLGMMIVLTLAFSSLFGSARGYPVYVLSGIIVWTFLAQTTTSAMTQLTWGDVLFQTLCPRAMWIDQGQVRGMGPSPDVAKAYTKWRP